jgi:hypothetical protein
MAILSNKGRVIQSLDNLPSPANGDLLVVQDIANNQTKNITFSQLATTVTALVQTNAVNFTDPTNRFTGSFKGGFAKLDGWLTALNNQFSVKGTAFSATGFNTVTLGSTGQITLTASGGMFVNSGLTVSGLITASNGVTGNLTGNVAGNLTGNVAGNVVGNVTGNATGDVYSTSNALVLESGTGAAKYAQFYGTASYVLSSSHANVADTTLSCVTHTTLADYATLAGSASYASQSRSSSYLRYTGAGNGSASYALKTGYASTALHALTVDTALSANTASFILYSGKFNGSASYARSSSVARSASYSFSGSYARRATSASHAKIADALSPGGITGPTFIVPYQFLTQTDVGTAVVDATLDCSSHGVPIGTKTVILDGYLAMTGPDADPISTITIKHPTTFDTYLLVACRASGTNDGTASGGQGSFPINAATGILCYSVTGNVTDSQSGYIRLIGYY